MTLSELKAQAARVFVDRFGTNFRSMDALEAMFQYLAENASGCDELLHHAHADMAVVTNTFAALCKQEG